MESATTRIQSNEYLSCVVVTQLILSLWLTKLLLAALEKLRKIVYELRQ
jgi:hypothetical protein